LGSKALLLLLLLQQCHTVYSVLQEMPVVFGNKCENTGWKFEIVFLILLFGFVLQSSWLSDEEFGMGYMELKPAASLAKAPPGYLLGFCWFLLVPSQKLWPNVGMR
jgi:hypothetical protein